MPVVTDGWIERSEKKCDFRVQSWQAEHKYNPLGNPVEMWPVLKTLTKIVSD